MGKKKGKKRVSFGGGILAHHALFFHPRGWAVAIINPKETTGKSGEVGG